MVYKYCNSCGTTTMTGLDEEWDYCPWCSNELEKCNHEKIDTQVYTDWVEQTCDECGATREATLEWSDWGEN